MSILEAYLSFWLKNTLFLVLLLVTSGQFVCAQPWMQGYNFRKKITIDKSKIPGASNLRNFNLLIEVEVAELKEVLGCGDGLQHAGGLPISFASGKQPAIPLGFQIDSYDPASGKLRCWVQVMELIAANNPGLNEMYFYYGGAERHDPLAQESLAIWTHNYRQVWHMNFDAEPATSFSAVHRHGNNATGNPQMNAGSFVRGLIGTGISFNGHTDYMRSAADQERTTCISGWIKLAQTGAAQVILANDSAANGWRLKISAAGKIVFDVFNMGVLNSHASIPAVPVNTWTYLTVIFTGSQKKIYINGEYKGGGGSPSSKGGIGETISIGRSKQNDDHFKGVMDELRIANLERSVEWISTEYRNQLNPADFIQVAAREVNPVQVQNMVEFTGANGTANWHDEGNWSGGQLPGKYTDVVIPAGKEVRLNIGHEVSLNRLFLRQGAVMVLSGNLEVNCTAQLAASSSVYLNDEAHLIVKRDLLNDGTIVSGRDGGTLVFKGVNPLQTVSGSGTVTVARLEVGLALPSHTLLLNAKVKISRLLVLLKGIFNANDQLTLLAAGPDSYASVAPVADVLHASVTGNVNIQQFIDGSFSSPSTARGWWLLSSPVYHAVNAIKEYTLKAIQQSVFVTGPGGAINGFDHSPNNNATIYTHNQALPGTLSQKYTGIPRMDVSIPFGRGFYIFSRGSRFAPHAYEQQIQKPPFSNPEPYTFMHSGQLFTGDLKIDLFNNNTGAEGAGYNLIGNPYASGITWGGLQKTDLSPFVWIFEPKNNAYLVTDQPGYVIPAGTGFFVKVKNGYGTGSVTFTESAKYTGVPVPNSSKTASAQQGRVIEGAQAISIKVDLKKDGLSDPYRVTLRKGGDDGITDADAQKIGEGHLSISGLTPEGHKLAIDERGADAAVSTIRLFVKGWASGTYILNLQASLGNTGEVVLLDHHLNKRIPVEAEEYQYPFFMDMENSKTYGGGRFSLLVRTLEKSRAEVPDKAILFYPNPVNNVIYLKSTDQTRRNLKVLIRTIAGNVVWEEELPLLEAGVAALLPCDQLVRGLYILQLTDKKTNKTIASFKMLKN